MNKDTIFQVIISVLVVGLIGFSGVMYIFCEREKSEMDNMTKQAEIQAQDNAKQFQFQQDRMERLNKDLSIALVETNNQKAALSNEKDALLQEVEKRQQMENDNKSIQTSLVDIQAEADAIKQQMKGWQKDYVTVLAQLEKKMDESQYEIKAFEENLKALNIPELKENINSLKAQIERMNQTSAPVASTPAADNAAPTDNSQTTDSSLSDNSVLPVNN